MPGSKPGERRGGRKAETPNRATADVKAAAQAYTAEAVATLATIMQDAEQPAAARVSAASAILDRGYGKPRQPVTGDVDTPPLLPARPDLLGLTDDQRRVLASIPVTR